MKMTAVSLFAGVGGFDVALDSSGVDVVANCEIDPKARAVLARHFPNVTQFADIQEVTGDDLRQCGFTPEHGILVGGFPCQDLSVAGRRAGLVGVRSGLFWEFHRLLEETGSKWFILENVPGLLSSAGGRDMGTVIGALADLGYGISYRILDAQYFGVPQRRRRVFIVGCRGDDGSASGEVLALSESGAGDPDSIPAARQDDAGDAESMPRVHRMLGFGHYTEDGTFSALKARDYKDVTDIVTFVKGRRTQSVNVNETWREDTVSPTVNVFDSGDVRATTLVVDHPVVRRLTPLEFERLQGFPDGWTEGQSDAQRYKQMGNAVAVPVVRWITKRLVAVDKKMQEA